MEKINSNDLKFKHPTTVLISGTTQSGKTVLTLRIINDWQFLFSTEKNKFNVLWFYAQHQNQYQPVENQNLSLKFIKGKPDLNIIEEFKTDVVILDDLMDHLKNDQLLSDFFTQFCHHKGISVFFLIQNLFVKGDVMRTISLNTHYFIIMRSPRAVKQIEYFSRQIKKKNSKEDSEKIYERATQAKPYTYLLIDLHPTTKYEFRYRSRITSEEVPEHMRIKNYKFVAPIIHQI